LARRGKAVLNKSAATKMIGELWQLKGALESKEAAFARPLAGENCMG
jgi:hypothetical protein